MVVVDQSGGPPAPPRSRSIAARRSSSSRSTAPPVRAPTLFQRRPAHAGSGHPPTAPVRPMGARPHPIGRTGRLSRSRLRRRRWPRPARRRCRTPGAGGTRPRRCCGRVEQEPGVGGQQHRHVVVGVATGDRPCSRGPGTPARRGASGRASAAGSRRCGRRRPRGCGTGWSASRAGPSAAGRTRRTCPTAGRPGSSSAARRGTRPPPGEGASPAIVSVITVSVSRGGRGARAGRASATS